VIQGESDYHGWQPSGSQPTNLVLAHCCRKGACGPDPRILLPVEQGGETRGERLPRMAALRVPAQQTSPPRLRTKRQQGGGLVGPDPRQHSPGGHGQHARCSIMHKEMMHEEMK
jgi:hypothetical protein